MSDGYKFIDAFKSIDDRLDILDNRYPRHERPFSDVDMAVIWAEVNALRKELLEVYARDVRPLHSTDFIAWKDGTVEAMRMLSDMDVMELDSHPIMV